MVAKTIENGSISVRDSDTDLIAQVDCYLLDIEVVENNRATISHPETFGETVAGEINSPDTVLCTNKCITS